MIEAIISLLIIIGLLCGVLSYDERNRWGMFALTFFIWPWLLIIEGTPAMERFIKWARKR